MVQTLRLFRKKKDDIWAIFTIEFFKLMGFIVSEYVVGSKRLDTELGGKYDVNLFWEITQEEVGLECGVDDISLELTVPECEGEDSPTLQDLKEQGKDFLYNKIIEPIWKEKEEWEERNKRCFECLVEKYCDSGIFYYLYNKGNLKFFQEFYPLYNKKVSGENEKFIIEESKTLKSAFQITDEKFEDFCRELLELKEEMEGIPYYEYALLKIKYKLNDIEKLSGIGAIFSTDVLLERIDYLQNEFPDFIRVRYLAAKICTADNRYLEDAEIYYLHALGKSSKLYPNNKMEDFLHYQLGRFYEKKKKDLERAYECYRHSYETRNDSYRAMYKIAKKLEINGKYDEAIEKINDMIKILLNGYEMREVMPKQQIYVYKCFVMLGNIYFEEGYYDLAMLSFQNAANISERGSDFYQKVIEDRNGQFEEVLKACMPNQPVYFKLISCAVKCGDRRGLAIYSSKLRAINDGMTD